MTDLLNIFADYQDLLVWVGVASTIVFVIGLLSTPFLIGLIPADYFQTQKPFEISLKRPFQLIKIIIKSLFGLILIIMGIIMLVTPGQGILSIMLGLFLIEFPAKNRLEKRLISQPKILKALNWLRAKNNKSPFEL